MLKKIMMITLYLAIGYQAQGMHSPLFDSIDRAPASNQTSAKKEDRRPAKKLQNICMIEAGDIGKLKYKGKSYEEAFSKVTDECFQRRTNMFVKSRNHHPDQDRQIQFAEACVNGIKCI